MSSSDEEDVLVDIFREPENYYKEEPSAHYAEHTLLSGQLLRLRLVGSNPLWVIHPSIVKTIQDILSFYKLFLRFGLQLRPANHFFPSGSHPLERRQSPLKLPRNPHPLANPQQNRPRARRWSRSSQSRSRHPRSVSSSRDRLPRCRVDRKLAGER